MKKLLVLVDKNDQNYWRSVLEINKEILNGIKSSSLIDETVVELSGNFSLEELETIDKNLSSGTYLDILFLSYKISIFDLFKKLSSNSKQSLKCSTIYLYFYGNLLRSPVKWMNSFNGLSDCNFVFLMPSRYSQNQTRNIFENCNSSILSYPIPKSDSYKGRRSQDKVVFGYGGRITPSKGIFSLINQFKKLQFLYPDIELYICGKSHYQSWPLHGINYDEKELQEKIEEEGEVKGISYFGNLSTEKFRKLLSSVDCFVYPSSHTDEDFGLSPALANSVGCELITTSWGALSELPGRKVRLFKESGIYKVDELDLFNKMLDFLNNRNSESLDFDCFDGVEWSKEFFKLMNQNFSQKTRMRKSFENYVELFRESNGHPFIRKEGDELQELFVVTPIAKKI